MTVSFHTAWKQLNPLNERQGLTVVTVICAVGGGGVGAGAFLAVMWIHHDSSEPVAEGVIPIGRNPEHQGWRLKCVGTWDASLSLSLSLCPTSNSCTVPRITHRMTESRTQHVIPHFISQLSLITSAVAPRACGRSVEWTMLLRQTANMKWKMKVVRWNNDPTSSIVRSCRTVGWHRRFGGTCCTYLRVMALRPSTIQLVTPQSTNTLSINTCHEDLQTLDMYMMLCLPRLRNKRTHKSVDCYWPQNKLSLREFSRNAQSLNNFFSLISNQSTR